MADPRFFDNKGPFTIAELALRAGEDAVVQGDGTLSVVDVAPLDVAAGVYLSARTQKLVPMPA